MAVSFTVHSKADEVIAKQQANLTANTRGGLAEKIKLTKIQNDIHNTGKLLS